MSEYHVISGDLALAINQLQLAQAVPGINDGPARSASTARIRELRKSTAEGQAGAR